MQSRVTIVLAILQNYKETGTGNNPVLLSSTYPVRIPENLL